MIILYLGLIAALLPEADRAVKLSQSEVAAGINVILILLGGGFLSSAVNNLQCSP